MSRVRWMKMVYRGEEYAKEIKLLQIKAIDRAWYLGEEMKKVLSPIALSRGKGSVDNITIELNIHRVNLMLWLKKNDRTKGLMIHGRASGYPYANPQDFEFLMREAVRAILDFEWEDNG